MPIQVLDQSTINKIAAGEVIERPSSVVKELVENAIDAGATAITIEIKEGGISFIRITDNGSGIAPEEIKLAFLRHSTSKIKSIEDLMSVSSLGFRGEALSSIAAVSQIELVTKTADSFTGIRYVIEGGKEVSFEEVGAPDGTTFIIRNLFFNTPVRRKFLKTAATEAGYINALLEHLSLSHPDISFRFISNNQNRLHTSGNMNLKDIIYSVYGRDITKNLIELDVSTQDIHITGFIGKPAICRGNRGFENYYINGRYIKSHIITRAIEEAYRGFIMPHNYPFTALHFQINPSILDVNVHPTKMELRFSKNEFVYQFVLDAITDALNRRELIPEVKPSDTVAEKQAALQAKTGAGIQPRILREPTATSTPEPVQSGMSGADNGTQNPAAQPEPPKPAVPVQKPSRLPEPFEAERLPDPAEKSLSDTVSESVTPYGTHNTQSRQNIQNTHNTQNVQDSQNTQQTAKPAEQMNLFEDKLLDVNHKQDYRIIGQLFDTYWLIEFEDSFYMMDQHAAHEKILYERLMKQFHEKTYHSQMIMPPVILTLSLREEQILKENWKTFTALGYEIEEFGGKEYKVTGLPAELPTMIDCKQLLIELIDTIADESATHDPERITEKVASMSCKAAVKGNNRLSFKEAEELMRELMEAENPYNCPHGRPTLIKMTKYEIERKFKRIL